MAQKYVKNMIFFYFFTAMATKLQQFTIGLCAAAMLSACSSGDATEKELNASRDAGRRQAEAALTYPKESMAREKAIFEIRARETRLRDAGFEECADAYIEAAGAVLEGNL